MTRVDYVMVPVPEELAPKVLNYINWKGHPRLVRAAKADEEPRGDASPPPDEPGAVASGGADSSPVARAFAAVDDSGRQLLRVVAAAALAQEELTVPEAARRAGLGAREALGVVLEVNQRIAQEGGPPVSILVKGVDGAAEREFTWHERVFVMPEPVARPVAGLTGALVDDA